jgi:hypothetical protein
LFDTWEFRRDHVTISARSAKEADMKVAGRRIVVEAECRTAERDAPVISGTRVT